MSPRGECSFVHPALHGAGPVRVMHQRLEHPTSRCGPVRSHEQLVLGFQTAGEARIEQQGSWSLEAGDAFLIPAAMPHRLVAAREAERWILALEPSSLAAQGASSLLEPFDQVRSGGAAAVRIPEARRAYLAGLFAELEREIAGRESNTGAVQRSLLTLVVNEVARAAGVAEGAAPAGGLVAEALRFIERHCLGPVSLQDVARAVRRSPGHVTTVVRRATGRSVQSWIIAGRLAEARRRLLHTDERVERIAERVGYADATHFIRLFRREHDATPAAWRARHARRTA